MGAIRRREHGFHYCLKAYPFDLRDQFLFITDLTVCGKSVLRRVGGREVAALASGGKRGERAATEGGGGR